ncbi:LamG-like jellyroll fold domain-containing protein [Leptospira idonii]|uniref:SbsA Ig-like domain-containing protein n=1 Tax=Leptospira idonii TaxID=1193500 RepID=A0A4R9M056_9LEPT|nr:LamG-like jellyroll fold domain-containing protein [Leptospira idonii]TGN19027.1 hypothetical protein EHS15_11500 [Leptospira idonii]
MKLRAIQILVISLLHAGCVGGFSAQLSNDLDFIASIFGFSNSKSYYLGGTVSGMSASMSGLQLETSGEIVTINANGTFRFTKEFKKGDQFVVRVYQQPRGSVGGQSCLLGGNESTFGDADIMSVVASCSDAALIEISVTGLAGSGFTLLNNGGDSLTVSGSGNVTAAFSQTMTEGTYNVTMQTQPSNVWQTCTLDSAGSNTGTAAPPFPRKYTIAYTCVTNQYAVKAYVTNLVTTPAPTGTLVVQESVGGGSAVDITSITTSATAATLSTLFSGSSYNISINSSPSYHNCNVVGATGTVGGGDVIVQVDCAANNVSVGGSISGLLGTGLVITANGGGGQNQTITAGSSTYAFSLAHGTSLTLTISSQPQGPTYWQTCTFTGTGTATSSSYTIDAGNVAATNAINIQCVNNEYLVNLQFTGISATDTGTISFATGSQTLTAVDSTSAQGIVSFPTAVSSGSTYGVVITGISFAAAGNSKSCTVVGGTGTIQNSAVTVTVNCSNFPSVHVTVAGHYSNFTLTETAFNNSSPRTVNANGLYSFVIPQNSTYSLTMSTPVDQTCTYTSGSASAMIGTTSANVTITCSPIVAGVTPADGATNAGGNVNVVVIFNKAIAAGSLTFNGGTKTCSGNFQVSANDFLSCVPIASISGGGTNTITLNINAGTLWYGRSYKTKVLNSVADTGGISMSYPASPSNGYLSLNGFNTGYLLHSYEMSGGSLTNAGSAGGSLANQGGSPPTRGVDGDSGSAYRFDGSSQYLSGSDSGLPAGASARTLCAWMNLDKQPVLASEKFPIISYGTQNTGEGSELVYSNISGTTLSLSLTGFGSPNLDRAVTIPLNTWVHTCVKYDGSNATFYVNGKNIAMPSAITLGTVLGGGLQIGKRIGTSDFFPGRLDGVKLFGASLPDVQIGYLSTQIPANLKARYNLNGNGQDVSGNDFDLSSSGTVTSVVDRLGVTNGADLFNSGKYSYPSVISTSLSNVTMTAWIRPVGSSYPGTEMDVIINGDNSFNGYALYLDGGAVCAIRGSISLTCSTAILPLNVWSHVAIRGSGNTWEVFINGIKAKTDPNPGNASLPTSPGVFAIGNNAPNTAPFPGEIDDARLYETALSDAQIQMLAGYYPHQTTGAIDTAASNHNLSLHLQAERFGYTAATGSITAGTIWRDSSPGANGHSTSTGTLSYNLTAVNGKIGIQFASGGYFGSNTNGFTGGSSVATAYYLFKTPATLALGALATFQATASSCSDAQYAYIDDSTSSFATGKCFSSASSSNGLAGGQVYMGESLYDATTVSSLWYGVNGGSNSSGPITVGAFNAPLNYTIGFNHSGQYFVDGYISEVLYFKSALSTADRNLVRCYLSSKYNIPVGNICN